MATKARRDNDEQVAELRLADRPQPADWCGEAFQIAEEKMDGWRVTIVRTRAGVSAFSRNETIDLWPELERFGELDCPLGRLVRALPDVLPVGTIIDGELCVPGRDCSAVRPGINRLDPALEFVPFAIPRFGSEDKQQLDAREMRRFCEGVCERLGARMPRLFAEKTRAALLARARAEGIEGVVLKAGGYSDWFRLKELRTVDAVVTRALPGRGGLADGVGSLEIGVYDGGVLVPLGRVGSGLGDTVRFVADPFSLLGMVVEVAYQEVTAGGKLRFPRFLRFREDKPARQCTANQLQGLVAASSECLFAVHIEEQAA